MRMQYIKTHISLPLGILTGALVHQLLRLAFEEYRWFRPLRYEFLSLSKRLDPDSIDYDALIASFEEQRALTAAAGSDHDYLLIYASTRSESPSAGSIRWVTTSKSSSKPAWRAAHQEQIAAVMQLVGSPLAQTGLDKEFKRKNERLIHDGISEVLTLTIRDYSEGLAGLFWRNFFGPPFVRLFGERLASVPGEFRTDLDGGIVLVQPYELPTQVGTPEGDARERELIARLGPECFYDHERHLKPTRLPDLQLRGAE